MRQGQHYNKNRSRGRNRRSNNGGNPANKVYDSNGPDVRVRGNAQTVADKYLQLARDAHSGGEWVKAESYYQHAEHYLRIVAAAQALREQKQAEREKQQEERARQQAERAKAKEEKAARERKTRENSADSENDAEGEEAKRDETAQACENGSASKDENREDDKPISVKSEAEAVEKPAVEAMVETIEEVADSAS